jgi:hypothetical protein
MGDVVDFKIKEKTKSYNTNTYGLDTITIDGVDIDWGDISYDGTLMTSIITDISQVEKDYVDELTSKNNQMENFIRSLLNPDGFGHAVSAEVRDEARYVLGMKKVETI